MTKSPRQLDAEIAQALTKHTPDRASLNALIGRVEEAIDTHPELTRARPGKRGVEEPELIFSRGEWTAQCKCRNRLAKGVGARGMMSLWATGATPEEAVEELVEKLPIWAEAIK